MKNKKQIVIATNLKLWSIANKVGAPSFYKTVEAYSNAGFEVVLYTTERNPDFSNLPNVQTRKIPSLDFISNRLIPFFIIRVIKYLLYQLIFLFIHICDINTKPAIYYAYEIEMVPALWLVAKLKNKPFISRFQGTILNPLIGSRFWRIKYFPHYFSLSIPSDLTIMTDDGTNGLNVLRKIRRISRPILFLKNGVDFHFDKDFNSNDFRESLKLSRNDVICITVSRLEQWKRVDRSIKVFHEFSKQIPNSVLFIIGDGSQAASLKDLVRNLDIEDKVSFTGGVPAEKVQCYMKAADYFLSHYQLSNLGNPLWEAIINGCLVITIDNGSTASVIHDWETGLISSEEHFLDNARKMFLLAKDRDLMEKIKIRARKKLSTILLSWQERMKLEIQNVENLLD